MLSWLGVVVISGIRAFVDGDLLPGQLLIQPCEHRVLSQSLADLPNRVGFELLDTLLREPEHRRHFALSVEFLHDGGRSPSTREPSSQASS